MARVTVHETRRTPAAWQALLAEVNGLVLRVEALERRMELPGKAALERVADTADDEARRAHVRADQLEEWLMGLTRRLDALRDDGDEWKRGAP